MKIAHIINPVNVPPSSGLGIAQPITFESMRAAQKYAEDQMHIDLFTAQFPEDRAAVPPDFHSTPDLDRSVLDMGTFQVARKLPLLRDILDRLYQAAPDADYLIYTNVDIALMPYFYLVVQTFIDQGFDALSINRRIIRRYTSLNDLPLMYAEIGIPHIGHDCFVFRRDAYSGYNLGHICIGAQWIGRAMLWNISSHADKFCELTDQHLTFHLGADAEVYNPNTAEYRAYNYREALKILEHLRQCFPSSDKQALLDTYPLTTQADSPKYAGFNRLRRRIANRLQLIREAVSRW